MNANRIKALESLHDFFDHISGQKQATHQIGEDGGTADQDVTNKADRLSNNQGDGERDVSAKHNGPGSTAVPNLSPKSGDEYEPPTGPKDKTMSKGPDANKEPSNPHDRMKALVGASEGTTSKDKNQMQEGSPEEEASESKREADAEGDNDEKKKHKYDMSEIMRKAGRTGTGMKGATVDAGRLGYGSKKS